MVQRTGFRSKDVSVLYHTAMCQSSLECKGHNKNTFAKINSDFKHVSGELWFLANVIFAFPQSCLIPYACFWVLFV